MNGFSLLMALASLGVVYSWRTGVDQQQEYVLQIEPEIVQALAAGEEIFSDVPADVGNLARLCITILPKDGVPARHTAAGEERFRQLLLAASRFASRDTSTVTTDAQTTILWPGRAGGSPEQSYGVTTGWQPDASGNQQYMVQIDPTVLSTLSIGDELYVPVDPSAGRLARFVVKAGRTNLPRTGGRPPSLLTQAPLANPTDRTRNLWTANTPVDPNRSTTRFNNGFGDTLNDNRSTQYQQPGFNNPTIPPVNSYTGFNQAPPNNGFQAPPNNGFDNYRTQFGPNAEAPFPNQSLHPVANQQPQLPPPPQLPNTTRPFNANYPDARVAGLPTNGLNNLGLPPYNNNGLPRQDDKPWGPLLFVTFALFFSIGGNLYLAYTALEFHSRYRGAIERLRSAARSA
jgi:hypothetical protein